jgi:hypothetical protein
MIRRLLVLTLVGSLGSGSLAFAGEGLLQSGVRIVSKAAETPTPRGAVGHEAVAVQEAPALAKSRMSKRTKILIALAAGVGFAATAYTIDHHVVDITPSSLGTRKD